MDSFTYSTTVSSSVPTDQDNMNEHNEELAELLNDEMTRSVLPVTVFVGIEVLAAFFGNLLVIYVFLFRYHVCNFRFFVLCLAFTDITSSLTTMPGEIVTQLYWYVYPVPQVCKIKSFFNVFTVSAEALCLLTIGLDRYRKVCRPLDWQIKPKHAKYICGIIYVMAFVIASPVYFFWGTHNSEKRYKNTTVTVTICERDEKWLKSSYPLRYSIAVEVIILFCLILMFVLYVFVVRTLLVNKRIHFRALSTRQRSRTSSCNIKLSSNLENIDLMPETRNSTFPRENKKAGKGDLQSSTCNVAGKGAKSNRGKRTFNGVITDDDHDPLEKHDNILPLIQVIDSDNHHKEGNFRDSHVLHRANDISFRVRRKTLIMFILTVVFIITTVLYLTLLSFIARSVLNTMSDRDKTVYFFFFRLYFINHVINPIIYGMLDPHFRKVITNIRNAVSATETTQGM